MIQRYMSVAEIANTLGLSRWKIREEIAAGRLAAVRMTERGDYRVTEDALHAWLAHRSPAA